MRQVSEGLNAGRFGQSVDLRDYAQTGAAPANRIQAGMGNTDTPADTAGNYVGSLGVVNGVITVTYSNATPQRANANINGATITLVPYVSVDQSVSWKCRAVGSAAAPTNNLMPGAANAVGTVLPSTRRPSAARNPSLIDWMKEPLARGASFLAPEI